MVSSSIDIADTVAQLKAAESTAKSLSDAAQAQIALLLAANAEQTAFIKAIDPHRTGNYRAVSAASWPGKPSPAAGNWARRPSVSSSGQPERLRQALEHAVAQHRHPVAAWLKSGVALGADHDRGNGRPIA